MKESVSYNLIMALTNEAMPEYVLVVYSDSDAIRGTVKSLSGMNLPRHFECYYACKVYDKTSLEAIRERFSRERTGKSDFFLIHPFYIKQSLQLLGMEDLTAEVRLLQQEYLPDDEGMTNEVVSTQGMGEETGPDEAGEIGEIRKKRPVLNFLKLNIPIGATLIYLKDESICVHVFNERKVTYKGRVMSLTAVTKELLNTRQELQGTLYWSYAGRKLIDIYNEIHSNKKNIP